MNSEPNGAEEIRTPDLLSAIQALSQLSYSPEKTEARRKTSSRSGLYAKPEVMARPFGVTQSTPGMIFKTADSSS
jgi:hypothetical protein